MQTLRRGKKYKSAGCRNYRPGAVVVGDFFVEEGVMQKRARQKLKMFTSLFLCIASLFSCVTLTLAWFAFNNNVSGGGIGVGAEKKADLIAYEY